MFQIAAFAILGGYATVAGLTWGFYRDFLYPAPRRGLAVAPPGAALREMTADDGQPVQVAEYGRAGGPTVVYFHGNGESIASSVLVGQELATRGLRFVAVEYRGYGDSPAKNPSEAGLYADAAGVLSTLMGEGTPNERITLWGNSLGSGVAVEMAARGLAGRLILQAPYTSIPAVAQAVAPIFPMRWLISDHFDSLSKADAVKVPTLILHGDADRVVPYPMGVTLSEAIADAELVTVAGAGHNDLFALEGDTLIERIHAWAAR